MRNVARGLERAQARTPKQHGDSVPVDTLPSDDDSLARVYARAIDAEPELAADMSESRHRYNAACSAILTDGEVWLDRALEWLRSDLAVYEDLVGTDPDLVVKRMRHWRSDSDLATMRDAENVPDAWRALWREVDELEQRALR